MSSKYFKQADREARITLGLYAFFFLWWTISAFGLGSGDPADYSYVLGLPAWFFYSCVLGYPLVTLLLWVVVRRCFVDMPLGDAEAEEEPEALDVFETPELNKTASGSVTVNKAH